jgi:EAL domain-containing protein (putative c-di-GMP-specific phosphodiesterase class I)
MTSIQPAKLAMLLRDGVDVETDHVADLLVKLLKTVRNHLGMEAAFVSRFAEGRRVFQAVDAGNKACELPVGGGDPLEDSYCIRVADGRLPQLIQNAQEVPAALELAATRGFPVGAHLSIPLKLSDGSVYGTFCCFSRTPDYSLNKRDLELLRMFADIAGSVIERDLEAERNSAESRKRVESVLTGEVLSMVYQPIVDLENERIVGFESLARFQTTPPRSPDKWFEEANSVGLGHELEVLAIQSALAHGYLADRVYVACNVSPEVVLSGQLPDSLCQAKLSRIVLEITEHSCVRDYENLECVLRPLRDRGLRLAVDDAGAGYSSFGHILRLHPDYIKLDMSITRGIDRDRGRRALTAALIGFAHETGSELIAEGVETASELATLRALGVHKGQGYLLGRPASFDIARDLVDRQLS